jgi:hypothetical protein
MAFIGVLYDGASQGFWEAAYEADPVPYYVPPVDVSPPPTLSSVGAIAHAIEISAGIDVATKPIVAVVSNTAVKAIVRPPVEATARTLAARESTAGRVLIDTTPALTALKKKVRTLDLGVELRVGGQPAPALNWLLDAARAHLGPSLISRRPTHVQLVQSWLLDYEREHLGPPRTLRRPTDVQNVQAVAQPQTAEAQSGPPPPGPPPPGPPQEGWLGEASELRGRTIYLFFLNKGLSPVEAAAFVGNFLVESGWALDPKRLTTGDYRGIAQWSASDRWQNLLDWAKPKGLNPISLQTQLDFAWHELKTSHAYVKRELDKRFGNYGVNVSKEIMDEAAWYVGAYYEGALIFDHGVALKDSQGRYLVQGLNQRQFETRFALYELWRGK